MIVEMITVGMFQSNCYVVACDDTKEAIIIDAGDEGERILSIVKANNLRIRWIVNTHAHIDHVSALPDIAPALGVPVLMHRDDLPIYANLQEQASLFGLKAPEGVGIDRFIESEDTIEFGHLRGKFFHTPGHSPGGVSLVFADERPPKIFVGDLLFRGSIGRTDLPGANHAQMMDILTEFVLELPDDMIVYPGHGPETTVGLEKRTNPFLIALGGQRP